MINIIIFIFIFILFVSIIIMALLNKFTDNYFNKEITMIGGDISNIPKDILNIINVRWPRVNVVTNRLFQENSLDKFYYSEKTDGLHVNVLIHEHTIYDITHFNNISELYHDEDMLFDGSAVLDTELYDGKYHIFDVYYLNGEILNNKFFLERMASIKSYLQYLGDKFVLKEFSPIPNISFLIDFIKNDVSPVTNENIDGVIIQRIDKPYITKTNDTVYKMKPRCLITVDFLLKYSSNNDSYYLYLIGSKYDYFNNLKLLPQRQKYIYDANGNIYNRLEITRKDKHLIFPNNLYILFDSPFIPNLHIYKNTMEWNKKGYPKRIINEINNNITHLSIIPDKFDNQIIEMSLTLDNKWVPLKIRSDKENPNGYKVGLDNISLIFDPIKPENEIYFHRNLKSNNDLQTTIHKINDVYRKYIAETFVNDIAKYATVLDLCGGRGGDERNLFNNGCSNFFVIDTDTTALKQYVDRSYGLKNIKYDNLIKGWKKPVLFSHININVLNHKLDKNYDLIKKDLESRYEWRGNAKIILMNYAIHYLCDSETKIKQLSEFIKSIMEKDGRFILTYFDGDYIYEHKDEKFGPFKIDIISDKNNITIAKLPVPTFQSGEDIYREEPLVHKKMLNIIDKYLTRTNEFNLYELTKSWIDKIPGYDTVIDYYKLINARIYTL